MNWDDRYSEPGFTYGTEPNDFLASVVDMIPRGKILSLAEGEGRNAVYLASRGYEVTGVDGSEVGLRKAQALARERGVTITTIHADLGTFEIGPEQWDGIIACYCHVPSTIRVPLHRAAVRGLKPGCVFVLEAFSQKQLDYGTGGPQSLDMLMALDDVKKELTGLEFRHAVQCEREVREGSRHTGLASVIQILGVKPEHAVTMKGDVRVHGKAMFDIITELKAKAMTLSEEGELPVWLLNDVLAIVSAAEQYGDKIDLVRQLSTQLENFDTYAGTGCFGDSVSAETILATIRHIKTV